MFRVSDSRLQTYTDGLIGSGECARTQPGSVAEAALADLRTGDLIRFEYEGDFGILLRAQVKPGERGQLRMAGTSGQKTLESFEGQGSKRDGDGGALVPH